MVTLAAHPLCGEELTIIEAYGRGAVRAETVAGKPRLLPLAWTSLAPRPDPLMLDGRAVRLAPEGLRELARWTEGRKLDLTEREAQKRGDGVGDPVRAGGALAAVVGQARAPEAGRRGSRKRGTR